MSEDDLDKPTCENCGYPASDLTEYDIPNLEVGGKMKHVLCDICANTFLSRATTNLRQYGQQAALFQSLGWIANMLRDEIRAAVKAKEEE
jgi:hypothetical protein